jgi:hypothetical protein
MYVQQQGPRLTGGSPASTVSSRSEAASTAIRFTINWSMPTPAASSRSPSMARVEGDTLTGTAKLGDRGTGQLTGTRTGQ